MDRSILEVFPNPASERDYLITHHCPEFTSVCPRTGQPDFGTIVFEYVPDRVCVELKSLKFYLQGYRNEGIFYEAVVNRLLDDFVAVCASRPRARAHEADVAPDGAEAKALLEPLGRLLGAATVDPCHEPRRVRRTEHPLTRLGVARVLLRDT